MNWVRTTPGRVWAVCILFALLQPATHALVRYCAPEGVVPTGLHKPDSAIFIHAMRMFDTGFWSPYATCRSLFGDWSARYFTTPFYILYAIAGVIGSALGANEFLMLGAANGFGAACYLLAVYHFMRAVAPSRADRAFALLSFSGGLGGALYLVFAMAGAADSASFRQWFYRFAIYDLVEGTNLAPYLLMPRLYYTLPLALGFAGLTSCIVAWRIGCRVHLAYAQGLLFVSALLNARLGPPLAVIALLYLAREGGMPWRRLLHAAVPLLCAVVCASSVMRLNPGFVGNVYAVVRQQMWPTSFISAGFPLLLLAAPLAARDIVRMPSGLRALTFAAAGYLAVFAALFLAHQLYYGALLIGADHAASVRVSDISLAGALIGVVCYAVRRPKERPAEHGWLIAWTALFVVAAVSAFGQGWSLRFAPQRLMVFLGIPLSLLAAESLARIRESWPRLASASSGLVYTLGLSSLAVSTLVFQGPLGMRPSLASDIGMHAAYFLRADAECLKSLGNGVVAAPWPYNDMLSLREGTKVIGGYGSVGLSDVGSGRLDAETRRFFTPGTPASARTHFLRAWCVAYVFLPSDAAARDALAREFEGLEELHCVAEAGRARLYQVRR
jgi:hypothetical protein